MCTGTIQPAAKTPWARVVVTRDNLSCMRCVHSKLAVVTKAPEGTGSKNNVTFASYHTNLKKYILVQILRGVYPLSCALARAGT
jgi:hypothetical protein